MDINMNETFMKEKPVFPLLLGMGMPMVLSMLVNSLYNIVDSYFVARISENAMEALSLVFPIQNFINAMAIGFGVGINALIATARGAGKENEARRAATQGVVLSVIHGIILSVICIVIMPGFLGMFTGDQEVIRYGVRYASVAFLFSPIIMAGLAFEKIFQAVGRMKVSMIALLGGCITNIILDPILIFGLAFFPKMGISGAAIATGVGQLISLMVYLAFYFKGPVPVKLEARYKVPGGNTMKKLYGIGIPAILNLALPSVMIFVLNGLLAQYSRSYVVILGIYYKLQTFLYFPASGIIQGMRFNKVDIAWYGNLSAMEAVDRANGQVFAQTVAADGSPGYWSVLIVNKDSPINNLNDLLAKRKDLTFGNGDPNSTSGFLVPGYYVFAKNNISASDFKRTVNAGHETNALAVANKQVDVATNNTENLDKLKTSAPEKLKELKVIWKSPLIPGDPIVWRKNLSETTKDKIYDFFMNYGKTPEEKAVLERLGWAPFRASSDLQLVPIRQLALFKEMQGVKSNKGLNEQDKLAKTSAIQAQLDDLDRLNNALSAMSSVSKAVQ